MDILALILAIIALLVFAYDAVNHNKRAQTLCLHTVGLGLLTAALICQFTTLSNHLVN